MSIQSGEDILAADFINESEQDGTRSNDSGRVPKLESDGYLSPSFVKDVSARLTLSTDATTQEDIEVGLPWDVEDYDTHALHDSSGESSAYSESSGGDSGGSLTSTSQWRLQEFTVGATEKKLTRVVLYMRSGNGIDTVSGRVHLRSSPTGANLATSQSKSVTSSSFTARTFYLPDYTLSAGTYYLVFETVSVSGTTLHLDVTNSGSGAQSSADSGSSWTSQSYALRGDFYLDTRTYFSVPEDGKYLIQATINNDTAREEERIFRIKVNNTVTSSLACAGGSSERAGGNIGALLSLSQNDIVTVTQEVPTSNTVADEGTCFEIIRLR